MASKATAALSAQEQAIESGAKSMHGNVTDRILRLMEAIRGHGDPRLTVDRSVLFTESFKTTEGQPLVLRWAKALKHIAENIPVTIFDDELIVARPNTWLGRYGLVYCELDGSLMQEALAAFKAYKTKKDPTMSSRTVAVDPADEKIINEVLFPYWNGRDFTPAFVNALPEETRHLIYGPDPNNISMQVGMLMCSASWRHSQNWAHDYSKMLTPADRVHPLDAVAVFWRVEAHLADGLVAFPVCFERVKQRVPGERFRVGDEARRSAQEQGASLSRPGREDPGHGGISGRQACSCG